MMTSCVPHFKYEPDKDKLTPDKRNGWEEKNLCEPADLFSHICVHSIIRNVKALLMPSFGVLDVNFFKKMCEYPSSCTADLIIFLTFCNKMSF